MESITSILKEVPADDVRWEVHTGLSPEQWAEGADSSSPPQLEGDLNAEPAREWLRQHARRPQTPDNKEVSLHTILWQLLGCLRTYRM